MLTANDAGSLDGAAAQDGLGWRVWAARTKCCGTAVEAEHAKMQLRPPVHHRDPHQGVVYIMFGVFDYNIE
jgi:hypothetical protein